MKTRVAIPLTNDNDSDRRQPGVTLDVDEIEAKLQQGEIKLRDMSVKEREKYRHLVPPYKRDQP